MGGQVGGGNCESTGGKSGILFGGWELDPQEIIGF